MKRTSLAALAVAALLGGCALSGHDPMHRLHHDRDAHRRPLVELRDGSIRVTPPVLLFLENEKDFDIVWRLPPDSPYRFAAGGVEIEGELTDQVVRVTRDKPVPGAEGAERLLVLDRRQQEVVDCAPRDQGRAYACRNKHSRPGIYKYTLRLTDGRREFTLDPPMVNW